MPTITLDKKALVKATGKKLSDKQLQYELSMLGTPVEEETTTTVTIEVSPNRPDLLSQQGYERALASKLGKQPGLRQYKVLPSKEKVIVKQSVAQCRPHTACAIIKGLTITEERLKEIITIQEKLHVTFGRDRKRVAIGIYPMEHITFPVTFVGLKPEEIEFTPLESPRELTAEQILEHHPKGKAYAHLLQGLERYACFIDAQKKIMSLTPIINSAHTGKITEKTTEVFVECSGFDQRLLNECLAMIVTALADMGGTIYSLTLEYPKGKKLKTPNLTPRKMKLDLAYANKLLGLNLKATEATKLLQRMGYGVEKKNVLIPAYRTDVLHMVDLVEDLAIAYGYDTVPEVIPNITCTGGEASFSAYKRVVRSLLVGHGLLEAKNYHLINSAAQTTECNLSLDVLRVKNAVSSEYDSLRAWILPSLFETLERNKQAEYPQALFEVGRVFSKAKGATPYGTGVREEERVAVVLAGETVDYTAIRQILDDLLVKLGLQGVYRAVKHDSFLDGRTARVKVGKEDVAYIGEVSPKVLTAFNLTVPVAAFELNLSVLHEQQEE